MSSCDKDGHLQVNQQSIMFPSLWEIHTNGEKKTPISSKAAYGHN